MRFIKRGRLSRAGGNAPAEIPGFGEKPREKSSDLQAANLSRYLYINPQKEGTKPRLSHLPGFGSGWFRHLFGSVYRGSCAGDGSGSRVTAAAPRCRDRGFQGLAAGFCLPKAAPDVLTDHGDRAGSSVLLLDGS